MKNATNNIASLNADQTEAFMALHKFIASKDRDAMFCLKGYAGTGKTYTITKFIETLLAAHPKWRIAMTAPTNKAVQVLRENASIQHDNVDYKTIHSLLGLKEVIQDSGDIEFERDLNEPQPVIKTRYKVLVIDEVSMLQDKLFFDIRRYVNDVKIILMGDPAQIPPVGKLDCEPFLNPEDHGIISYQLTKIMRQGEGSAIVETAHNIRENLENTGHTWNPGRDLQAYNTPLDREKVRELFHTQFVGATDLGRTRTIAWTNKKVKEYNSFIRTLFYGPERAAADRYIPGEILVMNKPYYARIGDEDEFLLQTNQEVKVISIDWGMWPLDGETDYKVYVARVEFVDRKGNTVQGEIMMIHADAEHKFVARCQELRQIAIHSAYGERKPAWRQYYGVLRSVANVNYAYAITAHKAQGSTYEVAIVDVKNMSQNDNIVERNRILYTAITRGRHLHVIL